MNTLDAYCYDCQAEVIVYGYFDGEWDLVEPPDADDHHTHDVSITGYA